MIARVSCRALLLAALAWSGPSTAAEWQGRVFDDRDGDGRAAVSEPGIAGVVVSDGATLAITDADGRYRLAAGEGREVFVVKPAGWRVALRDDGLPAFWRAPGARDQADFALRAGDTDRDRLRVRVFTDTQTPTAREVGHYGRAVVAPLIAGGADGVGDLGLHLGDVVDDDLALYPAINAQTARLGIPFLYAAGNHDLDPDADDAGALATFRRTFGPDTFAWEETEATVVVVDDVVVLAGQRPRYVGGLREDQFAFLEAYLARAPKDRLLLLALHIPLFDTAGPGRPETFRRADRERLFALLAPFRDVLVLSGHRHEQSRHLHGAADGWRGATPLHEVNVGAVSGAYWSGVAGDDGVPDATMADGTPRGHVLLEVGRRGEHALAYVPARRDSSDPSRTDGMALHAPRVLRHGAYPAWGVHANVWLGHARTRVEYRVADGDWAPMVRVAAADPWLLAENARDDAATSLRGHDRSPEAVLSTHLWRGTLPTTLAPGEHAVEVRVFDDGGREHRARTSYRLVPGTR